MTCGTNHSTIALIQARMGSSRMPGKTLTPLLGRPMIEWQLERLGRSKEIDRIVILTSTLPADDPLATYLENRGQHVFRGNEEDVLDRFYHGVFRFVPEEDREKSVLIRLTGDCPLIDPGMIDDGIRQFRQHQANGCRYMGYPKDLPSGMDFEILTWSALEEAHRDARELFEREHVTPYLWRNPTRFGLRTYSRPGIATTARFSVDYPDDLKFVEALIKKNGAPDVFFGIDRVIELLKEDELRGINTHIIKDEGLVKSCLRSEKFRVTLNGESVPRYGVVLSSPERADRDLIRWCKHVGIRVIADTPPPGWAVLDPDDPDWKNRARPEKLCIKTEDKAVLGSVLSFLCRMSSEREES